MTSQLKDPSKRQKVHPPDNSVAGVDSYAAKSGSNAQLLRRVHQRLTALTMPLLVVRRSKSSKANVLKPML